VDVEHGPELVVAGVLDGRIPGVAGVVDDDVEAAETLQGRGHEPFAEVGRGHVAGEGQRLAPGRHDLGDHGVRRTGIEVVDHHLRAVPASFSATARPMPRPPPTPGPSCLPASPVSPHFAGKRQP